MLPLFVLYVREQASARDFYQAVLQSAPILDVPGMTEFCLGDHALLGLMPAANIKKLLGDTIPDPVAVSDVPRAEIYLMVENAALYLERALSHGARLLSPLQKRDWGDTVAYCEDLDQYIVAFAEKGI